MNNFCIYRSFYVDELLSEMIGVEISIAIDIGLALGSSESIVESLYSVMKSQSMEGGQDNKTLALRYLLIPGLNEHFQYIIWYSFIGLKF